MSTTRVGLRPGAFRKRGGEHCGAGALGEPAVAPDATVGPRREPDRKRHLVLWATSLVCRALEVEFLAVA